MDKVEYLEGFAKRLHPEAELELEGECGFGRECVGIRVGSNWVDYDYDDLACPESAPDSYHKHPCIAVLGRDDEAVEQLYDWCKRFEAAGFTEIVIADNPFLKDMPPATRQMMALMGTARTPQIKQATK